jgi:ATP-dependent Clp protease ATP-binding subunit ClpA
MAQRGKQSFDHAPALQEVLSTARDIATAYNHVSIDTMHCLAAIIDTPSCAAHAVLSAAGADFGSLAGHVAATFPPPNPDFSEETLSLDETVVNLLKTAMQVARANRREFAMTTDVLQALAIMTDSPAADALWQSGLTANAIGVALRDAPLPDEAQAWFGRRTAQREGEDIDAT